MVDELAYLDTEFQGSGSRARCFLHVVNLVAKSIIRVFDIKKKDVDDALKSGEVGVEWSELAGLSREVDDAANERVGYDDVDADMDNEGGWMDEMELMGQEDRERLLEDLVPLKLALTKVYIY